MKRKSIRWLSLATFPALILLLSPCPVEAVHVNPVVGYGVILNDGYKPATATIVGAGIDILVKDSAGFTLTLEPTYIHTKVGGEERQIARGFLLGKRQLCTDSLSRFWRYFFVEVGVGGWTVLDSGGDDDEDSGATFRATYDTGALKVKLGLDIIDVSVGRNQYMPFLSAHFNF